jgi:hypothetical protein
MQSLESRITGMSDGQISEILFNREEWNEEAYSLAITEAKRRGLSQEDPHEEVLARQRNKAADAGEPLELKWKVWIALFPLGLFTFILLEKFRIDGKEQKIAECKTWMAVSIAVWLVAPLLLYAILGLI